MKESRQNIADLSSHTQPQQEQPPPSFFSELLLPPRLGGNRLISGFAEEKTRGGHYRGLRERICCGGLHNQETSQQPPMRQTHSTHAPPPSIS